MSVNSIMREVQRKSRSNSRLVHRFALPASGGQWHAPHSSFVTIFCTNSPISLIHRQFEVTANPPATSNYPLPVSGFTEGLSNSSQYKPPPPFCHAGR